MRANIDWNCVEIFDFRITLNRFRRHDFSIFFFINSRVCMRIWMNRIYSLVEFSLSISGAAATATLHSLVVSAELLNLSFRHLLDLWVYAIARLDDVAMPTCRTSDEAQCLLLNSPIRPCQLAQMYQYDRNQQQSLQAVLSGVGQTNLIRPNWERKKKEKFPNEIANRLNFDAVPKNCFCHIFFFIYRWHKSHREFNVINMINTRGDRTTWLFMVVTKMN